MRPARNPISFTTVNLVARETGWSMSSWAQADAATNSAFEPIATYERRFDEIAGIAVDLGFDTIDIWTAHLNPLWATPDHVHIVQRTVARRGLQLNALSGEIGRTADEVRATCELADSLGIRWLAGPCHAFEVDRAATLEVLRRFRVRLALENHPLERTPHDMLAKLDPDGITGTTLDTGWWATSGADPVEAIELLFDRLDCVHLKDVRAVGAHDNCPWGEGIVPVEECVRALQRLGYTGPITVEYEPEVGDIREPVRAMRARLETWLDRAEASA